MNNTNLIESFVTTLKSLSQEEMKNLKNQLFLNNQEISLQEIIDLSKKTNSFDFLKDEPDLYTMEDGESV